MFYVALYLTAVSFALVFNYCAGECNNDTE
jgi:hypothetical protein